MTISLLLLVSIFGLIPFFEKNPYLLMGLGELSIVIPVFIGARMLRRVPRLGQSLFTPFSPRLIPVLILLPFCLQIFVRVLTLPLHSLLYNIFGEPSQTVEAAGSNSEFLLQVFTVCLIPAVMEELLCRGVILRMLKPYGLVVSVLASAFAFSMLHFDVYSFLTIFMLGILLAAVRLLTGSIWACVLMHFANNLTAVLSVSLLNEKNIPVFVLIYILAMIIFPTGIYYLLKKQSKTLTLRNFPKKKPEFSIAMCICVFLFVFTGIAQAIMP